MWNKRTATCAIQVIAISCSFMRWENWRLARCGFCRGCCCAASPVNVPRDRSLLFVGGHLGDFNRLAGQVDAQCVNPSVSSIHQPEQMGIGHAGAVAEAAKDIDGSHFFINHKTPVHNIHFAERLIDLACVLVFIFHIGVRAAFESRAGRSPWGTDAAIKKHKIKILVARINQLLVADARIDR